MCTSEAEGGNLVQRAWWLRACIGCALVVGLVLPTFAGPLEDYTAAPDAAFGWQLMAHVRLPGGASLYQLAMVSQLWQGNTWQHRVNLVIPESPLRCRSVLLYVTGSGSGSSELELLGTLAAKLRAPMAVLHDVPNQPLFGGMREDRLIAHTFVQFMKTGDPTWPLLLPMAKSVIRAMDALSEYTHDLFGWYPEGFVVTGGSKRGWTTWLSAAVDPRIRGIAPIAYDNLNLTRQMEHQVESFGGFSEQIHDYTELGFHDLLDTERGRELAGIVDPYAYRHRFSLPKLIIRGSNDPYWPADALNLYLHDLPGETWIHYDPNAGHGLSNHERVAATLAAFYLHAVGELPLAPIRWETQDDGKDFHLQVTAPKPSVSINLWLAAAASKDFRMATWHPEMTGPGLNHTFRVPLPDEGYRAIYGEVVYHIENSLVIFDTPIQIIGCD